MAVAQKRLKKSLFCGTIYVMFYSGKEQTANARALRRCALFRILAVDDDKNTRRLIHAVLEKEGYTVTDAENGEEALKTLDTEHIDLIVLDIMMPKINGYELTETLRNMGNEIPILMVSAKQLPADRHRGFLAGTDDYITKPIDGREMLLRIKALLRRAKIASERHIVIGDVILDYDSLTVTGHGTVQVYKIRFRRLRHHLYCLLVKTVGLCKHCARHSREDNGRKRRRYIGPIIGASIGPDAFAIFGFGKEVTFALGEN